MGKGLYFPLFVDLSEKHILVVGAGKIAKRRITTMADFAGKVTVVAPDILPEIREMAQSVPHITLTERNFLLEDLRGADLVFAATNNPALNEDIAKACKEAGIPVNAAHNQKLCDFYFPGLVKKDPLVIGVTACGKDHAAAKETTAAIRELLSQKEDGGTHLSSMIRR